MTPQEITHCHVIDELIRRKRPFAMYRLPEEKTPRFVMQAQGNVRTVDTIEALNGQQGFVIVPFCTQEECPIVLIQPDVYSLEEVCFQAADDTDDTDLNSCATQNNPCHPRLKNERKAYLYYADSFAPFIAALRNKTFDKLVLSRSLTLVKEATFSPAAAFYKACQQYVHSYVYLCYTPQTGAWLGSTPEILLSGGKGEWNTVALAGTQSLQNGELPQEWDDKNREEQGYVSSYIRRQLLSFGTPPVEEGPYPAFAGALSHLKTNFHFSLPDNRHLGNLLTLLHPTPAVCGLPKEEAYQFILRNEGYDRRYYSGFIGWLHPEGQTELYVNLRCMHIEADALTLYAGGGLLASSELDDEWQETEKKLQTMMNLVKN